jgi:hypothetical protein
MRGVPKASGLETPISVPIVVLNQQLSQCARSTLLERGDSCFTGLFTVAILPVQNAADFKSPSQFSQDEETA